MLVPIVVIIAFMLALTGALLENSQHAAKVTFERTVARYADVAITDGVADFTHGLADYVARNGSAGPWPAQTSRSARKSACAPAADCAFGYVISAGITAASQAGAAGNDAALNLQAAAIDEQRVSAVVTATVMGATGEALGTRSRFLTYRVFTAPPYAVIAGARDSSSVAGSAAAAQGDAGGTAPATAPGADDTRIHVRLSCRTAIAGVVPFVNDQQGAGNDGLPWGNAAGAAYEAPCLRPDAPADAFRDERWENGDVNDSGWTP